MPHNFPLPSTAPATSSDPNDVLAVLKAALVSRGITLPSLDLDRFTLVSPYYSEPLIELGRCDLATAARLAEALEPGK